MSQNHNIVSAAEDLIQEHFELEPSLEQVIWINSDKPAEIRLLEINPETPATGSVMSFYFPPYEGFPYSTKIAEITPEEWQKILHHEIPLPNGWTLDNFTRARPLLYDCLAKLADSIFEAGQIRLGSLPKDDRIGVARLPTLALFANGYGKIKQSFFSCEKVTTTGEV